VVRTVPPHWHSEFQFCLITEGGGDLLYRGVRHHTPAGTMFAIHPGEVHANETSHAEGCTYRTFNVDPRVVGNLSLSAETHSGESFWLEPFIQDTEVMRSLLYCYDAIMTEASHLEMESYLLASVTALIVRYGRLSRGIPRTPKSPWAVRLVRQYLTDNHDQNISLSALAQMAGISPFHLARTFKDTTGMPPHLFQTQVRLERAKHLLRKGWLVAQVAAECGFADQSHLIRRFKRFVGVTPAHYRDAVT
jgi:AraC-like DNA-binding protein